MSQRELQVQGSLQQWKGINQRTQPTLVQDGFFIMALGIYFGLGDNAERITGKKLAGNLSFPIFQIYTFGNVVLLQGFNSLNKITLDELLAFDVKTQSERITEEGDTRTTEDGLTRITQ